MNSTLEPIIPNIATKIKEMSYLKQTYLKFIIDLFPLLSSSLQSSFYANQLILLLQNLINIHKNEILFDIEDALTSVLISYIFDMDELIKGLIDEKKYDPKHNNLIAINQQTAYYMKHHDPRGLEELREKMFMI
jgi:hypothetical protein